MMTVVTGSGQSGLFARAIGKREAVVGKGRRMANTTRELKSSSMMAGVTGKAHNGLNSLAIPVCQ
ncbi:hypothetical protein HPP92_028822 [Vanilla planifolia]|uniref:Uncharacterized protein n=1 Tax=Vanilla planifolia TaxID=51239 RepID=A0A835P400_VANPL|nr:hypothetical protein HPP92_028822 [Vanilla planifolia]KAG0446494.1 hypothetical protein HPP92_028811 [Vanilla planifolia]